MKPIEFPEMDVIFAKDQKEYLPLPAKVTTDTVITCWHLSFRERLVLLFTGRLWLQQMNFGGPLQPQLPTVDVPESVQAKRDFHDMFGVQ